MSNLHCRISLTHNVHKNIARCLFGVRKGFGELVSHKTSCNVLHPLRSRVCHSETCRWPKSTLLLFTSHSHNRPILRQIITSSSIGITHTGYRSISHLKIINSKYKVISFFEIAHILHNRHLAIRGQIVPLIAKCRDSFDVSIYHLPQDLQPYGW